MEWTDWRRIVRAYLLSIGFWFGISLLMGWQYRSLWSSYTDLFLAAGARALALALWTPPIFYFANRFLPFSHHRIRYLFFWALGVVPFVVLYTGTLSILLPPYDDTLHKFGPRTLQHWLEMIRDGFADETFIYIAIVVAAHAYEYFQRARRQELEAAEFHRALAVSELQALKMQLHPHFLFNTLHGIATLIENDPSRARAMIVKLSSLLRTTLQQSDSDLIPLREELKFVDEYLDLEKMRLGPRLTVKSLIDPATLSLLVPQLILAPLIENAVRHGIAGSRDRGWIEIASSQLDGMLQLTLRNSVASHHSEGMGVGLRNTACRLQHLYSGEATFSFEFVGETTAAATLVIPVLGAQQTPRPVRQADNEIPVQPHASAHR